MSFNYYEQTDTPGPRLTRAAKAANNAKNGDEKRVQGLTKSVVKRKRTVEADESEVEFSFTPTHPDKKKARLMAQENEEPPATRSTRPTRSSKQTSVAAPAKPTASSKAPSRQSGVGVRTSVPSKASLQEGPTTSKSPQKENDASNQLPTSPMPTAPLSEATPSKKRPASSEPSDDLEAPNTPTTKKPKLAASVSASPSTPSSSKKNTRATARSTRSTPSKTTEPSSTPRKGKSPKKTSLAVVEAPSDSSVELEIPIDEGIPEVVDEPVKSLPSPKSPPTSAVRELSPLKPSSPPKVHVASPPNSPIKHQSDIVAKSTAVPAVSAKQGTSASVPLEANPVSYWDFVNTKRGDKLIKRLVSLRSDGSRRYTAEEETSLRIVQERFFSEAERLHRPEDVFEPNPADPGLVDGIARYQRIIELLERENNELETAQRRIQNRLEDMAFETVGTAPTKRDGAKTPKKAANSKKSGATPSRSRRGSLATSSQKEDPTEDVVSEIMMSMPPAETLLSEEEKLFLEETSGLGTQLKLSEFSRLQTKFDSLELVVKQLGYINGTFEEKAVAVSAAMRQIMVPAAAPGKLLLSRIPISSPSLGHK